MLPFLQPYNTDNHDKNGLITGHIKLQKIQLGYIYVCIQIKQKYITLKGFYAVDLFLLDNDPIQ